MTGPVTPAPTSAELTLVHALVSAQLDAISAEVSKATDLCDTLHACEVAKFNNADATIKLVGHLAAIVAHQVLTRTGLVELEAKAFAAGRASVTGTTAAKAAPRHLREVGR